MQLCEIVMTCQSQGGFLNGVFSGDLRLFVVFVRYYLQYYSLDYNNIILEASFNDLVISTYIISLLLFFV